MKNILIIGGSSGIGLALVDLLSQEHQVFVASRTAERLTGENCTHLPFDAATDTLDASVLPELHGFVYCPGSINLRPFKGLKPETFQADFELKRFGSGKSVTSRRKKFRNQWASIGCVLQHCCRSNRNALSRFCCSCQRSFGRTNAFPCCRVGSKNTSELHCPIPSQYPFGR